MTTVADIMSRDVFTVGVDDRLDTVSWTLNAELVSGAPVCDGDGRVVGMISKTDIVEAKKPLAMTRASDAMSDGVWCVLPSDAARDVVKLMAEKNIHRVLVVEGYGAPIGIVTAMDVVRAVACGTVLA